MTQPLGTQPAFQRTPLDEAAIKELTADTPEMVELFQKVARRAGDMLARPVVSYANGREIAITFGQEVTVLASGEADA
jgi:hypothetical protein